MSRKNRQPARPLELARAWWERSDGQMNSKPLIVHLAALRRTLIICILAVVAGFLVIFLGFSKELVTWVTTPLTDQNIQVIYTDVSEAFTAQTKLSFIVGAVIASPVILAAVWSFIYPALKRKERMLAGAVLLTVMMLFALGIFFAYRYVFFLTVNFFVDAGDGIARPMMSLGTYVNFLFGFLLPFGIMFELPIAIVILTRIGLVSTKAMNKARKYVILVIFTLAAFLTPPDVVSQVMLGVPLWILFEVGVLLSWLVRPKERPEDSLCQAA